MFSIFFIFRVKEVKMKIDGIDKKIIRSLIKDARTPILSIARDVGISGAAIHQRLRKLEKSGLIAGSKFIVNPKVLGYTTMAYIGIFLDKAMSNPIAVKQLEKIPEVLECHYTTGNWSILIKVLCKDNEHLMHSFIRYVHRVHPRNQIRSIHKNKIDSTLDNYKTKSIFVVFSSMVPGFIFSPLYFISMT